MNDISKRKWDMEMSRDAILDPSVLCIYGDGNVGPAVPLGYELNIKE